MGQQARRHDRQHLLEVRHALEVSPVQLAAVRRTDVDLATLEEIGDRRATAITQRDRAGFVEADTELHVAVVAAAHNPVLTALYTGLVDTLRSSIDAQEGRDGLPPTFEAEHRAMVEAVRVGDRDAAAAPPPSCCAT